MCNGCSSFTEDVKLFFRKVAAMCHDCLEKRIASMKFTTKNACTNIHDNVLEEDTEATAWLQ